MIIPYSTDAPIYHWPIATMGMIVTNVVIFFVSMNVDPELVRPYLMELGSGLHPMQMLTHNFLHADILHLIGNMIFLWAYGIIVEGKIGWFSFLACYVAMGFVHGAAIQTAYAAAAEPTYVLGASGVIFGLMAMCMIWAPVNDLSCFFLFIVGFRIISNTIELPIYGFALLELTLEGLGMLFTTLVQGNPMSSALLHLSGAFWGLLLAVALVKTGRVDCEGWDVFALMSKRKKLREDWRAREKRLDLSKEQDRAPRTQRLAEDKKGLSVEERSDFVLARVYESVVAGDMQGVKTAYEKWRAILGGRLPREQLLELVKELQARQEFSASVPMMRDFCRLFPQNCDKSRLKLASILIKYRERPTEAMGHLRQIRAGALDDGLEQVRQKLIQQATEMLEDGVVELAEDD